MWGLKDHFISKTQTEIAISLYTCTFVRYRLESLHLSTVLFSLSVCCPVSVFLSEFQAIQDTSDLKSYPFFTHFPTSVKNYRFVWCNLSLFTGWRCFTCGRLVLRLLCVFYISLCVLTYHVHNNYVIYIVAMRPYFSRLRQLDSCFVWLRVV